MTINVFTFIMGRISFNVFTSKSDGRAIWVRNGVDERLTCVVW